MTAKNSLNYRKREMLSFALSKNFNPKKCAATQLLAHNSAKLDQPGKTTPVRWGGTPYGVPFCSYISETEKRGTQSSTWKKRIKMQNKNYYST